MDNQSVRLSAIGKNVHFRHALPCQVNGAGLKSFLRSRAHSFFTLAAKNTGRD